MNYRTAGVIARQVAAFVSGAVLLMAAVCATQFAPIRSRLPLDEEILVIQIALFSLAWSWAIFRWFGGNVWWCLAALSVGFVCLELADAIQAHERYQAYSAVYDQLCRTQPSLLPAPFCRSFFSNILATGSIDAPRFLAIISGVAAAAAILKVFPALTPSGANAGSSA